MQESTIYRIYEVDMVRLSEYEIHSIKEVIYAYDKMARVYLFGSRTDVTKKGGDIDLLVISEVIPKNSKRQILLALYSKLGEQKIDLIIDKDFNRPFVKIALESGILL